MNKTTTIAAALLLTLLTACGSKDAQQHYTDALSFMNKQQYNAAVIELKSAIQQAPENKDYRLTLGLLYLQIGDSQSAEKELARALSYGVEPQIVAIPLIRSTYQAGNYPGVLELFSEGKELTPELQPYVDVYHALAELELGDSDAALKAFTRLSTQQTFTDIAAFSQAHVLIANRNNTDALQVVSAVPADSPIYQEALFLKGRTQLAEEDNLGSIDSLGKYLEIVPNNMLSRLMLTQSLVKTEQQDKAEEQLKLLLKVAPDQPLANYLKAVLAYEKKDFTLAKEHAEKALNNGLQTESARIIAALSSLNLGLESQTLNHLDAIKNVLYKYPPIQNLYAALQLKAGQTDQVKDLLTSQNADSMDLKLLAATSFELIKKGAGIDAEQLIAKYEQSAGRDVNSLTTLGMLKLGISGQEQKGISDLEQALQLDPKQNQTRIVLAISYLKQGDYDKASALADEWVNDEKLAIVAYNLKAYSAMLQAKPDEASALLEKAQQASADNPFTLLLQAMLAGADNRPDDAKAILLKAMELHPTYTPALQQYYALSEQETHTEDAINLGQALLKKAPDSNNLRLTVARMYYQEQDYQNVVATLNSPSLDTSTAPAAYWVILIDSHTKLKHNQDVIALSDKWYRQDPENLHAAYFYATGLALSKRYAEAVTALDKQLIKHPDNVMLLRSKIAFLAENRDFKQALKAFDAFKKEDANQADTLFLKGRVLFLDGQIPPAIAAFNESYLLNPTSETAMFIAEIYSKDYSHQRAVKFLEDHFKQQPATGNMKVFYANLLLESDPDKSFKLYDEILQENPENYIVLNNYAWVLAEANKLDDAKRYIEKAIKQAPKHPDVLDTYGKVLMKLNKLPEAITAFEQSLAVRPKNDDVKLNYAEALARSNNKQKATSVLNSVEGNDTTLLKRKEDIASLLQ